jgi:hypothetical protein
MMKKLLQGGSVKPEPKATLTEEQQIQLATELSLESATEAAVKMSLKDSKATASATTLHPVAPMPVAEPLRAATKAEEEVVVSVPEVVSSQPRSEDEQPNPLAHLPKPDGATSS